MSPLSNRPPKSSKTAAVPSTALENAEEMTTDVVSDAASDADSPRLMRPIARPPAPEPTVAAPAAAAPAPVEIEPPDLVQRPIPAPSEPMQYRAIGLVRGTYTPSEEQFTRGVMLTDDGTEVEAVLLGRVMSLVKNHLALEKEHLWVVYPRTRDREGLLHLQVVGVWEPENLSQSTDDDDAAAEPEVAYQPSDEVEGNQFSIRGEIVFYSEEEKKTVVKITQTTRKKQDTEPKAFKLNLEGVLPGIKTIGYFWDLSVQRVDQALTILSGSVIAIVPPQKNPFKRRRFMGGGGRRPGGPGGSGGRPSFGGGGGGGGGGARPRPRSTAPTGPSTAPKPVKKQDRPVEADTAPTATSEASS
jgi:uncharacterized membrane protein YgcG